MSTKQNILDEYEFHGIKTVGDYDYYLLVDSTGNCVIARNKIDDSSLRYVTMPTPVATAYSDIATAIDEFWAASIENYNYGYLFQA